MVEKKKDPSLPKLHSAANEGIARLNVTMSALQGQKGQGP